MAACAVFEEVHTLPGSQAEFSAINWDVHAGIRKHGPDVGGRII